MQTRVIDATSNSLFWSTFIVGTFDEEWQARSSVDQQPVLRAYARDDFFIMDIQTREGAVFSAQGYGRADLAKTAIWTGPLFAGFLEWVRSQFRAGSFLRNLPQQIELPASVVEVSARQEGPVWGLVQRCLECSDPNIVAAARKLQTDTFGVPPKGQPSTKELKAWIECSQSGDP